MMEATSLLETQRLQLSKAKDIHELCNILNEIKDTFLSNLSLSTKSAAISSQENSDYLENFYHSIGKSILLEVGMKWLNHLSKKERLNLIDCFFIPSPLECIENSLPLSLQMSLSSNQYLCIYRILFSHRNDSNVTSEFMNLLLSYLHSFFIRKSQRLIHVYQNITQKQNDVSEGKFNSLMENFIRSIQSLPKIIANIKSRLNLHERKWFYSEHFYASVFTQLFIWTEKDDYHFDTAKNGIALAQSMMHKLIFLNETKTLVDVYISRYVWCSDYNKVNERFINALSQVDFITFIQHLLQQLNKKFSNCNVSSKYKNDILNCTEKLSMVFKCKHRINDCIESILNKLYIFKRSQNYMNVEVSYLLLQIMKNDTLTALKYMVSKWSTIDLSSQKCSIWSVEQDIAISTYIYMSMMHIIREREGNENLVNSLRRAFQSTEPIVSGLCKGIQKRIGYASSEWSNNAMRVAELLSQLLTPKDPMKFCYPRRNDDNIVELLMSTNTNGTTKGKSPSHTQEPLKVEDTSTEPENEGDSDEDDVSLDSYDANSSDQDEKDLLKVQKTLGSMDIVNYGIFPPVATKKNSLLYSINDVYELFVEVYRSGADIEPYLQCQFSRNYRNLPQLISRRPVDLSAMASKLTLLMIQFQSNSCLQCIINGSQSEKPESFQLTTSAAEVNAFRNISTDILVALSVECPFKVVPELTASIFSKNRVLDDRLLLLNVLVKSSQVLARKGNAMGIASTSSSDKQHKQISRENYMPVKPLGTLLRQRKKMQQRDSHVNGFSKYAGLYFYLLLFGYQKILRESRNTMLSKWDKPNPMLFENIFLSRFILSLAELVGSSADTLPTYKIASDMFELLIFFQAVDISLDQKCIINARSLRPSILHSMVTLYNTLPNLIPYLWKEKNEVYLKTLTWLTHLCKIDESNDIKDTANLLNQAFFE